MSGPGGRSIRQRGPLIGVYPPLARLARRAGPERPHGAGSIVPAFPFTEPGLMLTHLGRGAVWLALLRMGLGPGYRIAMPAYHCGSEVEAARLAGLEVAFYRVDESLGVDEEDMARVATTADATYVISHFGFPPVTPPPGARVVEDVAHGLFSYGPAGPLGSTGETAVFCPRKSLGVPDGGAVLLRGGTVGVIGRPPAKRILRSVASLVAARAALSRHAPVRGAAVALFARASRGDAATERGTVTEEVIGDWDLELADMETAASSPSRLTARLAPAADADGIRERRRRNYAAVAAELGDDCPDRYRELPAGVCPLYFPVLVADRPRALVALREQGVRAAEIWPVPHPLLDRDRHAELEPMRRRLLALPVHQDLEPGHVDLVIRAAKAAASRRV